MTLLKDAPDLTTTSNRRARIGLMFATVILGGTLTACGSGPGDTTCGELKDMDSGEVVDLLDEAVDDEGTDEEKDQWNALSDEEKAATAELIPSICEGEDDGTKLDDIEGF